MPLKQHIFFIVVAAILLLSCKPQERPRPAEPDPAVLKYHKLKKDTGVIKQLQVRYRRMYEEDQATQRWYTEMERRGRLDSSLLQRIADSMTAVNSRQILFVDSFLQQYGWPAFDLVGERCGLTFFLIIQHADLKWQEKYLPVLVDAVYKRNAQPWYAAYLLDRIMVLNGRKQYFGSQLRYDALRHNYGLQPLQYPKLVNEFRRMAGMRPIEDYVGSYNNRMQKVSR